MKLNLYRYLIREQLIPVSICIVGLTLILITGRLMQVTQYLFSSSASLTDFVELVSLALPKLLLYAFPMATLIGVLLAFVRLKEDNELVAMRAAGISFLEFWPAVVSVVSLTTLISFFTTVYIMPNANHAFVSKLKDLGRASIPAILQEGTFIDIVPNLVFFFRKVDSSQLSVQGIFIQDHRSPELPVAIVAEHARLIQSEDENEILFRISDGIITRVGDKLENAEIISFRVYDFRLSLDELIRKPIKGYKHKGEMSLQELLERIREGVGFEHPSRYALEFHQRLALPISCFLLGMAAAPLGALFRQGHRIAGVTVGLVVFLAYYVVLSAGKGLGENDAIPAFVAIWFPNALTASLVLFLWTKMQREKGSKFARLWERICSRFPSRWKNNQCDLKKMK
jgi:lipopolysaccharide export system permease protein